MSAADPKLNKSDVPSQTLQPLTFPLHGSRLIEASAGTGKTWTIAALYVRLVLGHGNDAAYSRPLTPPEILVATFTDAASQELRDRIRTRLSEAASFFMPSVNASSETGNTESFLADLRAAYSPEQWPSCARKLQLAAEWMDEAAVSTIHGWCSRMLREHAFDSNSLFTLTLETDQTELMIEVVRDYWRTFIITLSTEHATMLRTWWSDPEALLSQLENLVSHQDLLTVADQPSIEMERSLVAKKLLLTELKESCCKWIDELQEMLTLAISDKLVDGRKLQLGRSTGWLEALRSWAQDPNQEHPELSDTAWNRLSPEGLQEAWKQGSPPPTLSSALAACVALRAGLADLPIAKVAVLCHATHWVAERFAHEQQRQGKIGFNEQLTGLNNALQGPNGLRLATTIRQQFPVVLIDEFQDTDPVQYQIFDTIYRIADNSEELAIVLIGDPKQAIYGFRGADIYTYLAARQAATGRLYTLQTNYRSTAEMVEATNSCFALAEARENGAGAFLFRQNDSNPLPFINAQAQGRDQEFSVNGTRQPALTVWQAHSEKPKIGKTHAKIQLATACACEIARLLGLGQVGLAGFKGKDGFTPLLPKDIAVLVNTRTEANDVREELSRLGVRSVYLSNQDSVLKSPLATEMYYWLMACAEPNDSRNLRAALGTRTLGLSWEALDQLTTQETLWEQRVLQFRAYGYYWHKHGVLPMLRRLLTDFDVPARLLATTASAKDSAGERALTDILHLAELLQCAGELIKGQHALVRYFVQQITSISAKGDSDAQQVRLESDADLIQIVTVHKSKGLEYPLVFLPFAWNLRPIKPDDIPIKYHNEQAQLQLALSPDADALIQADHERLGEDLRKLYVGMTRARYATWLGMAATDDQDISALGYLLGLKAPVSRADVSENLAVLAASSEHIVVDAAPEASQQHLAAPSTPTKYGPARTPQRDLRDYWWISSYSGLAAKRSAVVQLVDSGADNAPATHSEDRFTEALLTADSIDGSVLEQDLAVNTDLAASGLLHEFPRGPGPGSFLHDLLEWTAELRFAKLQDNQDVLRDLVARRCNFRGWEKHIDAICAWLLDFTSAEIQLGTEDGVQTTRFSLAKLNTYSAEMEFLIPANDVDVKQLDTLVCAHTLDAMPRPELQTKRLNGMLKGFIDLVFELEGRYYVADYKSNYLGPDDAAYTLDAMHRVVADNRYDLQSVLYLLALHRLLKVRLPNYDYDEHIGGALCFFLRGLHAPSQGVHFEHPTRQLIEALDQMFSGANAKETA